MKDFNIGVRVTNGTDIGVTVKQQPRSKRLHKSMWRTLVVWDREYKGCKQTGYPLTADLEEI